MEDEETPEPMTQEVFFLHIPIINYESLLVLEVEDEEHGSSTPYAVIALCFCSLGNLHSEYLNLLSHILSNSTESTKHC